MMISTYVPGFCVHYTFIILECTPTIKKVYCEQFSVLHRSSPIHLVFTLSFDCTFIACCFVHQDIQVCITVL
jgi:hypothetical protein